MPPILSLIDDEALSYKAKGCDLLLALLGPLEQAKSDILGRTNLDSVFQEALSPCLLSLPTITPENESIHLLKSAYPAILAVIRVRFQSQTTKSQTEKPNEESQKHISALTNVLRHSIISSYNHISSPRPTEDTPISSFPYPRLSTLLLTQLSSLLHDLGIHSTKHLRGIIPLLTSTLTNPFGTAYLPLLAAAAEATRLLILNAWPRVWRWRGEFLAGLCGCWLHICRDEADIRRNNEDTVPGVVEDLDKLRNSLKENIAILRIVVMESLNDKGENFDVSNEFANLVDGDEQLDDLLIKNEYFKD